MILDITAGNRHIWGGWMPDIPEPGPVVYSDIEPELRIRPDVVCDLKRLPYRNGVADAVIFDPPTWSFGTSRLHGDPKEAHGSFWGNFKNLKLLKRLLAGGVRETRTVLKPDGILYLKWSDAQVTLKRFYSFFIWGFEEVDRESRPSKSGRSDRLTHWVRFKKREELGS